MLKVYFIGVQSLLPYRVAMDQVFKFEASSRVLSKETVHTVGTNIQDPILRIRCVGLARLAACVRMPAKSCASVCVCVCLRVCVGVCMCVCVCVYMYVGVGVGGVRV